MRILKLSITKDVYPPEGMKFAYVRHPVWEEGMFQQMPSAIKYYPAPSGIDVKADVIPVLDPVWQHIAATNNFMGYQYAQSIGSLWINRDPINTNGIWKSEAIMSGGNIVGYYEESTTRIKPIAYGYQTKLNELNPYTHNIFTMPWLYWECSSFDKDGHSGLVWGDTYCFIPRIQDKDLWMNKTDLWLFPPQYKQIHFRNAVEVWNGSQPLVTFENGRILRDPGFQPPASVIPPLHRSNYIEGA